MFALCLGVVGLYWSFGLHPIDIATKRADDKFCARREAITFYSAGSTFIEWVCQVGWTFISGISYGSIATDPSRETSRSSNNTNRRCINQSHGYPCKQDSWKFIGFNDWNPPTWVITATVEPTVYFKWLTWRWFFNTSNGGDDDIQRISSEIDENDDAERSAESDCCCCVAGAVGKRKIPDSFRDQAS